MRDTLPFLVRLGLEPNADVKDIRRAYARELKKIDQTADPEGFQELRTAYEIALQWHAHQQASDAAASAPQAGPQGHIEQPEHIEQPDHAEQEQSPAPSPDEPYQLADLAFMEFARSVQALVQSPEARHQSRWKAALQAILDHDALVNLTARTIFEARIAHLLATGWQAGHETLFVVACDVFDWSRDSRRILQFGESGALVNRAIDEWKLYESMPANAIGTVKQLIQTVRTTPKPAGAAARDDLMLFHQLAGRFYSWFNIIIDRQILQEWSNAVQAEIQRGGVGPATPIEHMGAPAEPAKQSGSGFSWPIVFLILAIARGCSSLMSDPSPSHSYSPPPVKLEQLQSKIELGAADASQATEEQLRAVQDHLFYTPDPNKVFGVLKVTFEIQVDEGGKVIGLKKTQASQDLEYDEAVARTLRNTQIFPPGMRRQFSATFARKSGGF